MRLGIDIYQGDGIVNFDTLSRTPVTDVILKLSQGTVADVKYLINKAGAASIGREVWSYHLYDYRVNMQAQVDKILSLYTGGKMVLDAEGIYVNGIMVAVPSTYEADIWKSAELLSPRVDSLWIYTAPAFFTQYCPKGLYWAYKYPLWIANYKVAYPVIPLPWSDWQAWQYTDRGPGRLFGLQSLQADLSYIR